MKKEKYQIDKRLSFLTKEPQKHSSILSANFRAYFTEHKIYHGYARDIIIEQAGEDSGAKQANVLRNASFMRQLEMLSAIVFSNKLHYKYDVEGDKDSKFSIEWFIHNETNHSQTQDKVYQAHVKMLHRDYVSLTEQVKTSETAITQIEALKKENAGLKETLKDSIELIRQCHEIIPILQKNAINYKDAIKDLSIIDANAKVDFDVLKLTLELSFNIKLYNRLYGQ